MKKIMILAACCLMITTAMAQTRHLDAYCSRQSVAERTQVSVPGFLLRFCADDPELKPLMNHMNGLRILHLEKKQQCLWNGNGLDNALQADGYEEVISVKDGGEQFGIYIISNDERIKRILLAVDSREELVLLSAKVHMTMEELSELLSSGTGKEQLKGLVTMNK